MVDSAFILLGIDQISTVPEILPGSHGDFVVKSKLFPRNGFAAPYPLKGAIKFF